MHIEQRNNTARAEKCCKSSLALCTCIYCCRISSRCPSNYCKYQVVRGIKKTTIFVRVLNKKSITFAIPASLPPTRIIVGRACSRSTHLRAWRFLLEWEGCTHCLELVLVQRVKCGIVYGARYVEPTGLHEMGGTHDIASSCLIMVYSNHETKLCGMLITFKRVWAVGRFAVGRVFLPCHINHELEQSPPAMILCHSGVHQNPQLANKGELSNLEVDGTRYTLA